MDGSSCRAIPNIVFKLMKLHLTAGVLGVGWGGRGGSLEQLRDIIEDKKITGFQIQESICFAFSRAVLIFQILSHCLHCERTGFCYTAVLISG